MQTEKLSKLRLFIESIKLILSHFFDNFILLMFRALVIYRARSFYIYMALSCVCHVSVHMYCFSTIRRIIVS